MDYKETVELEENIKIKNESNKIYNNFIKYYKLNIRDFKDGGFKVWSDSHNATYIKIVDNRFVFMCDFLHEKYTVTIAPETIFDYIKEKYRGLVHFQAELSGHIPGGEK